MIQAAKWTTLALFSGCVVTLSSCSRDEQSCRSGERAPPFLCSVFPQHLPYVHTYIENQVLRHHMARTSVGKLQNLPLGEVLFQTLLYLRHVHAPLPLPVFLFTLRSDMGSCPFKLSSNHHFPITHNTIFTPLHPARPNRPSCASQKVEPYNLPSPFVLFSFVYPTA